MLKKLAVLAFVFLFLGLAATAVAQDDEMKFNFGVKAGWYFWMEEDLTDEDVDNTWSVGVDMIAWMSEEIGIGVGANLMMKDIEDTSIEYKQYPFYADLYYKIPMDYDGYMYFAGGASFVFADLSMTEAGITVSIDDTAFGYNLLYGYQFETFFLEAQYTWAKIDFGKLGFDDESINVGGFSVMGGIRF